MYSQVKYFCLFIGDGRSGSTLTSSMIDAHPNAIISLEENIFEFLDKEVTREDLYHRILVNSSKNWQRQWTGYSYEIKNQWQGSAKNLAVVGDKQAGRFTITMNDNRDLCEYLKAIIGVPIKVFHSIRNPYDIIATRVKWQGRSRQLTNRERELLVNRMIEDHFNICDAALKLREEVFTDIMDVRHELFVGDPRAMMYKICDFLELEPIDNYIRDCCALVHKSAHKSRYSIQWSKNQLAEVDAKLKIYSFLGGYGY